MQEHETASPGAGIEASLDRIHDLIRAGDLAGLAEAAAELESRIASVEQGAAGVSPAELERIRLKSARNAACLEAAARGIRAARRRVAEVRAAASGAGAYDAQGQRVDGSADALRLARRF